MFDASAAGREREATVIGRGSAETFDRALYAANRGGLATKTDSAMLRPDFIALRSDFAMLRADFADLRVAFRTAINKMLRNQIVVGGVLLVAMILLKFS